MTPVLPPAAQRPTMADRKLCCTAATPRSLLTDLPFPNMPFSFSNICYPKFCIYQHRSLIVATEGSACR